MKKLTIVTLLVTAISFSSFGQMPNVTSSSINYWVGNGSNEAIFVAYLCHEDANNAYAWGYRWSGTATVEQMLRDIDIADSRLTVTITSWLEEIVYTGAGTNDDCSGMWMYTLNGSMAGAIGSQQIQNNEIAAFFCSMCSWGDDLDQVNIISVDDPNPPVIYTVTASSNTYGNISPSGDSTVLENADILYHFTANDGYFLDSIILDETTNVIGQLTGSNTYLLEDIQSNHTLRAVFTKMDEDITYTIHAIFGDQSGWITQTFGSISPAGDSTVVEGSSITYFFTPNAGYRVGSVTLGGEEKVQEIVNNGYTVSNIRQDDTLWVLFAVDKNNIITADDILYWIGEGSNEIIFAVNWCIPEIALAWGYRFDGDSILVSEIMDEVKATDSRYSYEGASYVTEITYKDNTYDLASVAGDFWMYNVNEEYVDKGIDAKYVFHGDIIEFGGMDCGLSDDFGANVWTTTITAVSIPAPISIASRENATNHISVYPNPTNDYTSISISGIKGNISMKITDINGKIIQTEQLQINNNFVKRIETNAFAKGIYFIYLQNKDVVETKKLIVY